MRFVECLGRRASWNETPLERAYHTTPFLEDENKARLSQRRQKYSEEPRLDEEKKINEDPKTKEA
jgi:hypothetical protein